jgi:hypothetical protein
MQIKDNKNLVFYLQISYNGCPSPLPPARARPQPSLRSVVVKAAGSGFLKVCKFTKNKGFPRFLPICEVFSTPSSRYPQAVDFAAEFVTEMSFYTPL